MESTEIYQRPKTLILATLSGGCRGTDAAGQAHLEYPSNTYILIVMSAAMLVLELPFR